jgi:hypothetical protein
MPLPNTTVTKTEFETLMQYISLEKGGFSTAQGWANSGLQYVVLMQRSTPEIDLLNDHAAHYLNLETQNNFSNFTSVVNTINSHVSTRGTTAMAAETLSARLNRWLWCQGIRVTRTYADISAAAGWSIDWCNVRSNDADPNSQMGPYILDEHGIPIAIGCTPLSPYINPPAPGSGCPWPTWQAGFSYAQGSIVKASIDTGWLYQAVQPTIGVSGGVEPVWPNLYGTSIGDGTVLWTTIGNSIGTKSP